MVISLLLTTVVLPTVKAQTLNSIEFILHLLGGLTPCVNCCEIIWDISVETHSGTFHYKTFNGLHHASGRPHHCPPTYRLLLNCPLWDFITGRVLLSLKQTKIHLHGQIISARISPEVLAPCRFPIKSKAKLSFFCSQPCG